MERLEPGAPARRNCFDALRLFAALAVLGGHATRHLHATFLWHHGGDSWWFIDGVPAFFILSGLMVYRSAERCREDGQPWRQFYKNRALRIVPAIYVYLAVHVLVLAVAGVLQPREVPTIQFGAYVLSHLVLAPVYHPAIFNEITNSEVNGSLWTIPVEVSFYVVVPLIVLAAARFGFRQALAGTMALASIGLALYLAVGGNASQQLLGKLIAVTFMPFLWFFGLGILWTRLWPRVSQAGAVAWVCLAAYVALSAFRSTLHGSPFELVTAVAALPLSYVLVWVGYRGPAVLSRITTRLGDLSFGTYIWHLPIIKLLVLAGAVGWAVPGTLLVLLVVALAMAVAALSWWFVERPALRLKTYSLRREAAGLIVP